jgi:hypothetical protein
MNKKYYFIFSILILWPLASVRAASFGGAHSYQVYSCLGLDGVPITGGTLETECCANGNLVANPPDDCRAGFYSIANDATASVAYNVQMTQKSLSAALQMSGATTDYNNITASTTAPATGGSLIATTSAATAGASTGSLGTTTSDLVLPTPAADTAADSSGGSGGSAGGGGGGLDTSQSGASTSAATAGNNANSAANAANSGGAGTLAYASTGSAGGGAGSGYGNSFGGGGTGNSANGKNALDDNIAIQSEKDGKGGVKNASLDEDAGATEDDPADYFKKIDQSANLFQVVSNRYFKKKSLWKVN